MFKEIFEPSQYRHELIGEMRRELQERDIPENDGLVRLYPRESLKTPVASSQLPTYWVICMYLFAD